jgi:hypothetical protein
MLGPGSDASYWLLISDITIEACKNLLVVSNVWYDSETLSFQRPSYLSDVLHIYRV